MTVLSVDRGRQKRRKGMHTFFLLLRNLSQPAWSGMIPMSVFADHSNTT